VVKVGPLVNGYSTYLFASDGSKEGWSSSDAADKLRERFVESAKSRFAYPHIALAVVGGDDDEYDISGWDRPE
jgi:hypothetical protein